MTREEHIIGLNVMKPYLQKKMREINYEGLGELDALEVGKTIDFAIEAIEALEKAEKYKWHDLRKNPNDLPILGDNIIIGYINMNVPKEIIYISYETDEDCLKNLINGKYKHFVFIGWKYIEPFEEVSE